MKRKVKTINCEWLLIVPSDLQRLATVVIHLCITFTKFSCIAGLLRFAEELVKICDVVLPSNVLNFLL